MIAMCVVAQQELDVGELEAQLLDLLLNHRHVPLVRAVDENGALWRHDEEGRQGPRADVIDVPDDLVRRKGGVLVFWRAHVARQDRSWRIGLTPDRYRRMVRWRLALRTYDVRAGADNHHGSETRGQM